MFKAAPSAESAGRVPEDTTGYYDRSSRRYSLQIMTALIFALVSAGMAYLIALIPPPILTFAGFLGGLLTSALIIAAGSQEGVHHD